MSSTFHRNVLFLASEADPLIKVGGLGDVAGSLPRSLKNIHTQSDGTPLELDVRLVLPFHPAIARERYSIQQVAEYTLHSNKAEIPTRAYTLELDGLPVYLISGAPIDEEPSVYSANLEDDGFKYVYFSLVALELARELNWKPDILHANDWHTSPAVYSLKLHRSSDPFFNHTSSLLTIHNLPYLGAMTGNALETFGLPAAKQSNLPSWAQQMALPLGLLSADAIVAVSPGYAKEILTEDFGAGLQHFLAAHQDKISGILNGLDTQKWDPVTDPVITARFSPDTLALRAVNKSFLQAEVGLEQNPHLPLLAMVTRMDPQKGVDLAISAIRSILLSDAPADNQSQVIFLGTGDPTLEQSALQLVQDFPNKVRAVIKYDAQLSRHIYAGADMFLMPSRYEPCGLSQMIAMRYGCVPIARLTGGLSDTIHDPHSSRLSTGFLFRAADPDELVEAIRRAVECFTHDPKSWQAIQIRGMHQDFSWDHSALEYLNLYQKLW